jgi:hypothetical protein
MARDIFISHSARDKTVADAVCAALEGAALRCWVAPRDVRPGHSFAGEITRAIRQSKVIVLIFSGHSNKSEQVLREVQLATDCHLPIVRFRIEDVTLTDDLTYFLATPHWLDALTPPLSKHIETLEIAVKELLGHSVEATAKDPVSAAPSADSIAKKGRAIVAEKSSTRWKLVAIAAVLVLAVIVAFIFFGQPARRGIHPYEPTPLPTPAPTRAPEPTATLAPQPTPTAEPTRVPALNAGPAPRNDRTWRAWIDDFVHQYVRSSESNDAALATSFFGPTVNLFDEGLKPLDSIRRDTEAYNTRWPTRRATIRGDVQTGEKTPDRGYTASFQADYYVENRARGEWINLAVSVDLQIVVLNELPKISSIKQKTLRKEKGGMQTR